MTVADGGVFENLNLGSAIVKCREQGVPDHKIIVDIVTCFDYPIEIEQWSYEEALYKSVSEIQKRKTELKNAYYYLEDIERVMRGFQDVQFRYILQPSKKLPSKFIPIISTLEEAEYQLTLGRQDMLDLIESGKVSNNKHIQKFIDDRQSLY